MWFRQLIDNQTQALTYVLGDPASKEVAVLDPQPRDWPLLQALTDDFGGKLKAILLTHNHQPDRLQRLMALKHPLFYAGRWHCLPGTGPAWPTNHLPLGNTALRMLPTPGHTLECTSFLWEDRLFCGDLLDTSLCTEQPHPQDTARLWESLQQQVLTLPADTLLYPAHIIYGRMVLNLHDYPRLSASGERLRSRDVFMSALENH
jgi:glyoxylase-like metal-dependent hydrolase (beta-lactamase superfamily II)